MAELFLSLYHQSERNLTYFPLTWPLLLCVSGSLSTLHLLCIDSWKWAVACIDLDILSHKSGQLVPKCDKLNPLPDSIHSVSWFIVIMVGRVSMFTSSCPIWPQSKKSPRIIKSRTALMSYCASIIFRFWHQIKGHILGLAIFCIPLCFCLLLFVPSPWLGLIVFTFFIHEASRMHFLRLCSCWELYLYLLLHIVLRGASFINLTPRISQ